MFEIKPRNKYLVIEMVKEDEKVGSGILFAPGNALEKQHKVGRVVAVAECEEAEKIHPGDTILYDAIGAVTHRIGNQSFTTVKVLNVLGVIVKKEEADGLTKAIVEGHG